MSSSSDDGDDSGIRILRHRAEIDELAEYNAFQESRRKAKASLGRLLDGENTPQNIALYGFVLGILCGGGLIYALVSDTTWPPQMGYFLCALALFHFLEYLATALFNPDKLSLDSFLINHSPHYHAAHAASLIEFIVEYYFFPNWKTFGLLNYIGLLLVIVGQTARTTAMFSARHNFSHKIVDYKAPDHQLVQHGIYRLMRHPSYFGFYWWAIGVQCLLLNPICFGLFIYWLHRFFSERIAYEEYTLLRFFGDEWNLYKSRTPTGLPLIA
ncbi:Isoprenylcysteine carboxyl methyltransferase family-domain-containing protein [Chlamydoabsidia padenii]|nr:Isoprenylcysteine carboxyl methyltransferase family-domain-containing protein [Chlamydoabsidia padenii]